MLLLLLMCWIFYKELIFQFKNCYKCACSNIYTKGWKQLKKKGNTHKTIKNKGNIYWGGNYYLAQKRD